MSMKPDLGALYGASGAAKTFLGLETCDNLGALTAPVAIIGAPCATPYASVGAYCRNGPDALRKATSILTANVDRHDFDLERLRKCCHHYPQIDGRVMPACGFNMFHRGAAKGANTARAPFGKGPNLRLTVIP